jgi:hypothetical protein
VRRAARRQPGAVIEPTLFAAQLARHRATRFRQSDGFLDEGVRIRREVAAPIRSQGSILFLDLAEPEGAAVGLDRGPDPDAHPVEQVAPSEAAFGRPFGRTREISRRPEEVVVSLDELQPPIFDDARHTEKSYRTKQEHSKQEDQLESSA